jgi:uncharacterized protein YjbI with pentapeptide repeats
LSGSQHKAPGFAGGYLLGSTFNVYCQDYPKYTAQTDLLAVNLTEASLIAADLHGANLQGADLHSAALQFAEFNKADLALASINNVAIDNFTVTAEVGWNLATATDIKYEKKEKSKKLLQEIEPQINQDRYCYMY